MATVDQAAAATARLGKHQTSGSIVVGYRDTNGRTRNAKVLGPGGTSGVKLQVIVTGEIIDNVAAATAKNQTGVYFSYEMTASNT
jgi:hypothetical protein